MGEPWKWWSADTICQITKCPAGNVHTSWPLIADALDRRGIYTQNVARGVLGTVTIETASEFMPIDEFEDWGRFPNSGGYDPTYGGGPKYHGRGYVQLTHDYNYRAASAIVGVDLIGAPEHANDPKIAAEIVAWWFATKGVPAKTGSHFYTLVELCESEDWEWVRRAVQGGTNGLDRLITITTALGAPMPKVIYDPQEPAHAQDKSFDCSQEALEWAMWSLGRKPQDGWMEATMIAEGVMSPSQGLLDATGAGLAAFVGRQWGEFGFYANSEPSVTFDGAALEGGHIYPLLIGGRAWGHWSGLKAYDAANDLLILANPSDGWKGVHQTMSRAQFDTLGPFSMVRVLHPDLLGETVPSPAPTPAPAPPIPTPDKAAIAQGLQYLLALHIDYDTKIRAEYDRLIALVVAL